MKACSFGWNKLQVGVSFVVLVAVVIFPRITQGSAEPRHKTVPRLQAGHSVLHDTVEAKEF
jgi:hypothetical protein